MQEKIRIISNVLGKSYKSSGELLFRCPYCKSNKHKFSVNLEKNVYKCWVCDTRGRDLYRIVRRFGSFTDLESWKAVSGVRVNLSEFDLLFSPEESESEKVQIIEMPPEFKTLTSKKIDDEGKKVLQYLNSRSVNSSDILKWKMGYCPSGEYRKRIIIPSFDDRGNMSYFVARSYSGDYMRYKNPPASRNIIFNELYLDFDMEITLVEGVFDAIKANNAVPILGSTIREDSRLFRKIIKHDTPVLLALDPDAKRKSNATKQKLLKYGIEVREVKYKDNKDIGDMSKDEVKNLSTVAPFISGNDQLIEAISAI
jgi:DNA primase